MKWVYGVVIIVVTFGLFSVFARVPPPDALTVKGVVYQLEEESGDRATYESPGSQSKLSLRRFELESAYDPCIVLGRQIVAQGATRVSEGRFWKRERQTHLGPSGNMTHISVTCVAKWVTELRFTEDAPGALYSAATFQELERVAEDIPRRTRRFFTWLD